MSWARRAHTKGPRQGWQGRECDASAQRVAVIPRIVKTVYTRRLQKGSYKRQCSQNETCRTWVQKVWVPWYKAQLEVRSCCRRHCVCCRRRLGRRWAAAQPLQQRTYQPRPLGLLLLLLLWLVIHAPIGL